jgi:hypothetical protein
MCVLNDDGRQLELDGAGLVGRLDGPCGRLKLTGKLFIKEWTLRLSYQPEWGAALGTPAASQPSIRPSPWPPDRCCFKHNVAKRCRLAIRPFLKPGASDAMNHSPGFAGPLSPSDTQLSR